METDDELQNLTIKGRTNLAAVDAEESAADSLLPAVQVDSGAELVPAAHEQDVDADASAHDGAARPPRKRWLWIAGAVVLLSIAEAVHSGIQAFSEQDWLAGLWLLLLIVITFLAIGQFAGQWRSLGRLKQQQQDQIFARQIYASPAIGQGQPFCESLAERLPPSTTPLVEQWRGQLKSHYNDAETLALFEQTVLGPADKQALKIITDHAKAAGVMIAVSPFALLDMAIVLWRQFRMLGQVCDVYGMPMNYWGKVSLIRRVFKTMLYAGASEIAADAGTYALGAGITGKLSTRIAQGLGASVLTARIGLKTMQSCRPLPFKQIEQPNLNGITHQLLKDLRELIR